VPLGDFLSKQFSLLDWRIDRESHKPEDFIGGNIRKFVGLKLVQAAATNAAFESIH
jgi:hypothetical protein